MTTAFHDDARSAHSGRADQCPLPGSFASEARRHWMGSGRRLDELSKRCGIAKSYVSSILSGKARNPPPQVASVIETVCGLEPGSLSTLLLLEQTPGPIRDRLMQAEREAQTARALLARMENGKPPVSLPIAACSVPLLTLAGGLPVSLTELSDARSASTEEVPLPGVTAAGAFALRLTDDSMAPGFLPNDIVGFVPTEQPVDPSPCLVLLRGEPLSTFRQVIRPMGSLAENAFLLQASNPRFPSRLVRRQEIDAAFAARAVLRTHPPVTIEVRRLDQTSSTSVDRRDDR